MPAGGGGGGMGPSSEALKIAGVLLALLGRLERGGLGVVQHAEVHALEEAVAHDLGRAPLGAEALGGVLDEQAGDQVLQGPTDQDCLCMPCCMAVLGGSGSCCSCRRSGLPAM